MMPNPITSLDAASAYCLQSWRHGRGASELLRSPTAALPLSPDVMSARYARTKVSSRSTRPSKPPSFRAHNQHEARNRRTPSLIERWLPRADAVEPVSVLTIYTSTEPSLKCSPPTSPVRPKATGRVHLPIACNPARPPDRSDESRAPLPHRHRKCCHASSPERGQRIGTYVPSSFNSQLSTINYPVAGPPRPAPPPTASSSRTSGFPFTSAPTAPACGTLPQPAPRLPA